MNTNNNLKYNNSSIGRTMMSYYISQMKYNSLDGYYNSTTSKWMVKNNLNNYEVWGIIPTVSDLSTTTKYKGKLVVLFTDSHEYEWNGRQWNDLGYVNLSYLKGTSTSSYWETDYKAKINSIFEIKFKRTEDAAISAVTGIMGSSFSLSKYTQVSTTSAGLIRFRFGQTSYTNTSITLDNNVDYVIKFQNGQLDITANGETTTTTATTATSLSSFGNVIFGNHSSTTNALQGEISYFKIWQDETLVHHYVPNADLGFSDLLSSDTASLIGTASLPTGSSIPKTYGLQPDLKPLYQAMDNFDFINNHYQYNIDANNEIVEDISTATKNYAYNKTDSKWYVKNDANNYEQWGIMPTVSDLSSVTTYTGKLVILSTDSHEYKWNGSEWVDLGEYTQVLSYLTFGGDTVMGLKYSDVVISTGYKIQSKLKLINSGGNNVIGCLTSSGQGLPDTNDFRLFKATVSSTTSLYYDCGNTRNTSAGFDFTVPTDMEIGINYIKNITTGQYIFNQGTQTLTLQSDAMFWIGGYSDEFDIYYVKVYDENNNLLLNLIPDYQNNMYGMKNLIDNTFSGHSGIVGHYESSVPEEYPSKPAPTLAQSKNSFKDALSGSYLNGQTVTVYGTIYNVNNKLVKPSGHWEYVTANTDRTKGFTKIRCTSGPIFADIFIPTKPNINCDGKSASQVSGEQYGYANITALGYSGGVRIHYPTDGDWTNMTTSNWNNTQLITSFGTYIGTGQDGNPEYEITLGATRYWGGYNNTSFYTNNPYHFQIYIE